MTSYMTTDELGLALDMLISSDGYIPYRKRLETIYQKIFSDRPTKDKKGVMKDLEELYWGYILTLINTRRSLRGGINPIG